MDFSKYINLKVLPRSVAGSEAGSLHLPYKDEVRLMNLIHDGKTDELFEAIKFIRTIPVGALSENNIKQYRYIAICFITLAVRYAISGGMDEDEAYSFSDYFIRQIDRTRSPEEIINHIAIGAIRLSNSVKESRTNAKYSPYIRKCIKYVNDNLDRKITVSDLSDVCGVSCDYLSTVFKKEYGTNLSCYIMDRKLDAAAGMLLGGKSQSDVCYTLAFSSQSYFISVFRKKYGVTPGEYIRSVK